MSSNPPSKKTLNLSTQPETQPDEPIRNIAINNDPINLTTSNFQTQQPLKPESKNTDTPLPSKQNLYQTQSTNYNPSQEQIPAYPKNIQESSDSINNITEGLDKATLVNQATASDPFISEAALSYFKVSNNSLNKTPITNLSVGALYLRIRVMLDGQEVASMLLGSQGVIGSQKNTDNQDITIGCLRKYEKVEGVEVRPNDVEIGKEADSKMGLVQAAVKDWPSLLADGGAYVLNLSAEMKVNGQVVKSGEAKLLRLGDEVEIESDVGVYAVRIENPNV